MKANTTNKELIRKIATIGILTALVTVLSYIRIPIGGVTVTLMLPAVVIGAALYGPLVGAWLTVIPALITLFSGEAAIFTTYSPFGGIVTILLKGLLAGFLAGLVYKLIAKKSPIGGVICAAALAPTVNSGIFVLGCYLFIWDELMALATEAGVGVATLLIGLAGINYVIELALDLILCPTILRIIQIATKKNEAKKTESEGVLADENAAECGENMQNCCEKADTSAENADTD